MAVNLDDVDDLINSISMNDAQPAPPSNMATPSGSVRQQAAPAASGSAGEANSGFDLLESMMSQLESGRMSVAPGPLKASVIPKQATAQSGVSMGPGASFGPGAAGRGISSGPGAAMGRGISSGPGAAAAAKGKGGVVSAGPGAAALASMKAQQDAAKIKMADYSADGRKIVATGPPCVVCSQMILGRITNALGKQFHPECFKCKGCGQQFKETGHIEHEDNAYCDPCYWNNFAPKCCRCSLPIKEKLITCIGKSYHIDHFCCCGCGSALAGKKYKEFEEDPYCLECFRLRERVINPAAHICAKCKKPIFGEYLNINGQKMHPEHYKCEACGRDFLNGDCHEYDGKLYCEEDYRKLLKHVCFGCRKPIAGRSLTAMGRVWHPEHFVCAHCHEPFPNSNFFEHEGKPYCDLHYAQLFAQVCSKCEKPVIGTALFALGKYWHQEHYICHYCDKLLSGNDTTVMEWEGKGMCRACYYKLPADVRKAYEKQKDAAKKAADRRMADEKNEKKKQDKEEKKAMKAAMANG